MENLGNTNTIMLGPLLDQNENHDPIPSFEELQRMGSSSSRSSSAPAASPPQAAAAPALRSMSAAATQARQGDPAQRDALQCLMNDLTTNVEVTNNELWEGIKENTASIKVAVANMSSFQLASDPSPPPLDRCSRPARRTFWGD